LLRGKRLTVLSGNRLRCGAFTLLELMTVIVIISILVVMILPLMKGIRERADRAKCVQNLKSLHVAATNYLQTNHNWPEYRPSGPPDVNEYGKSMFDALRPFGAEPGSWICPSIQRLFNNPDYTQKENFRVDYVATPFSSGEATPFRWSTQPWFAEKSNLHGGGPLMIFSTGDVMSLSDVIAGKK
jgi:prepilin-type N-terminal cleavage/methylation domain-containing protein